MTAHERWVMKVTRRGVRILPNPLFQEPNTEIDSRARDGKKTVIIHGKRITEHSPRSRWPGSELWGAGRCAQFYWHEALYDWTRWFDLHPVERSAHHKGIKALRPKTWDWYCKQSPGKPIYLLEPHPDCPASVSFPRAFVQDTLKTSRFTVSVDWMIGLALCEGFERIVLNGIGTRFQSDYQFAHQGILYWIGYAQGRGVDVIIDRPSCYAETGCVYGYEIGAPAWDDSSSLAMV